MSRRDRERANAILAALRVLHAAEPDEPGWKTEQICSLADVTFGMHHPPLARLERTGVVESFWADAVDDVRALRAAPPRRRLYRLTDPDANGLQRARPEPVPTWVLIAIAAAWLAFIVLLVATTMPPGGAS